MPQMSPMLWTMLFIYFILLFMIFNLLNYFMMIPIFMNHSKKIKLNQNKKMNWKW